MKKLIRKWLGIPENYREPDLSEYIRKYDIKKEIKKSLDEAFQSEVPPEIIANADMDHKVIINRSCLRGEFDKRVSALVREEARTAVSGRISHYMNSDSFLDHIVKRIKNKQL